MFLLFDVEDFDDIELTKFGKRQILRALAEVKGIVNQSQVEILYVHVAFLWLLSTTTVTKTVYFTVTV